jgi:hypothetical protein
VFRILVELGETELDLQTIEPKWCPKGHKNNNFEAAKSHFFNKEPNKIRQILSGL